MRAKRQHGLKRKAPLQAGCDAGGDLRGLDGDGAGAATRIEQRAVLGPALPARGGQHGCGQRFFQRRVAFDADSSALRVTPAAFEQCFTRGVGVQRGVGRRQKQGERQVGVAGVDAGPLAQVVAHHVTHCVFDPQRGEVQALQR